MKLFPMTCLMLGIAGLTACGGGSSNSSNTINSQSETNKKVADQVFGYEFSYSPNGSKVTMYEQAVENQIIVNNIKNIIGKSSDRSYQYDYLTDKKKFQNDVKVSNNKVTFLGEKLIKLTDTGASLQSDGDEELVSTLNFSKYDISGKKITEVLSFSGDFKKSLDSLPSTQNTFGNQQSCKYIASESYSKAYMEYDEVFQENAKLIDLNSQAERFLTKRTINGKWLGKPWIVNIDKSNGQSYADGLVLDNGKVHNVNYYTAGKTINSFTGCEIFTKAQADFIVSAIKAASK